ncbi:hypothetical protein WJX72_009971 [[Myrmecia] bisecta]|uniref:peptidylprolyl isomerase n=1 Tax=[Myrmecia] bisecta TaxID=41462 RepID=A0AAW1R8N8_9CHLO
MADLNGVVDQIPAGMEVDEEPDYAPAPVGVEKGIIADGGVIKKIITAGTGWEKPESGDEVTVHYTGTLLDGTKFDSSRDRNEPFKFKLGIGNVIKGWDIGVATMSKGEKAVLTCKADYAYGKAGSPPKIPADATLKFEVELLSWCSIKDIAGDGGVIKTVLQEADSSEWETPADDDELLVKYKVRVQGSDTPFSSSGDAGVEFTLQDGYLCPAFQTALKTMKMGERVSLLIKPEYGFGADGQAPDVPPNAELEAEVELVSWKKVEKVTADGCVIKKTLVKSKEWRTPNSGSTVRMRYTARLRDGTVFDERKEGNELEVLVDEEQVINGLDQALQKMKEHERAEITIAPEYGFGAVESQQPLAVVPANSTVIYTVELVSLQQAREGYQMDKEEKVVEAGKRKASGNAAFKAGKWARAIKKYNSAISLIEHENALEAEQKQAAKDIQKSANLNLAAVHLKLGDLKEALKACNKVLESDSSNVKALYRRAQAYLGSQDHIEAECDIKRALEVDPHNRDVRALYKKYKADVTDYAKKERQLYSKLFAPKPSKAPAAAENGAGAANGTAAA